MAKLTDMEGIGPAYAQKLQSAGVQTIQSLLEKGATPKGRESIAEVSGISLTLVLKWVNHADLFRIHGIGEEYADLLEQAGVDTVVELSQRKAENLFQKMTTINQEKQVVRKLPTETQVKDWIDQAKKLPRIISY
jgi:predicted flap endonuclease-1-like 5' DNA nuclease